MSRKWTTIKKCARKAGLGRLFALCNQKDDEAHGSNNAETKAAYPALQRPETYTPSGAPWTKDAAENNTGILCRNAVGAVQTRLMFNSEKVEQSTICEMSELLMLDNNGKQGVAVLLSDDLREKLQSAVKEDRLVMRAEEVAGKRITRLDDDLEAVQLDIEDLDDEVAELEESSQAHAQSRIAQVKSSREELQKRAKKISCERKECNQALEARYRVQGYNCHKILSAFEKVFVDAKMLPAELENIMDDVESEAEMGAADVAADTLAYKAASGPSTETSCLKHTASGLLRRKNAMMDLKASELSAASVTQDNQISIAEAQRLVRVYEAEETRLRAIEDAFDSREGRFDREADERDRQILAGKEVESELAFDMRQLQETRRMGNRLAEAEDAVDHAKAALVAAGIQLQGSHIESGFVDDVNDGYRISAEQRVAASVDPKWIFAWMDPVSDLSDADEIPMPKLDAAEFGEMETEVPELDDWDARSVGVSESGSMVAAGPYRRRIDKWQSACEAVGAAEIA